MSFEVFLVVFAVLVMGGAVAVLGRDAVRNQAGTSLLVLIGLLALFLGERVLGEGSLRLPVSGGALLVLLAATALRAFAWSRSSGHRRAAHASALVWTGPLALGLLGYGLTLDTFTSSLGLDEDGLARWVGSLRTLGPVLALIGVGPLLTLDRVLNAHPRVLPAGLGRRAVDSGLGAALVLALVGPLNYLATKNNLEWDYAYFRTARPGSSTQQLAATLPQPVEALLFFPPGNDVAREIEPYFRELAAASGGQLTVRVVDQVLEPALSEKLKLRENGHVAFVQGESQEKFKLGLELDKAKRDLRRLDASVYEHLSKVTRGQRKVYFLTGHGEASHREREEPLRKLTTFKGDLETLNIKVENLGVSEGSGSTLPDDAALVVLAAPTSPLLPEELSALQAYAQGGGNLLLLLEPGGYQPTELMTQIGVRAGTAQLVNAEQHLRQNRGKVDRSLLVTNKFGSHASVSTLAKNSQQLGLVMPTALWVSQTNETKNKVTTLIRTLDGTWEDLDGDFELSGGEEKKTLQLAVAVEAADATPDGKKGRSLVVGDVNFLSDPVYLQLAGSRVFALDAIRWLVGEEDLAGEINSEEDVKIVHTREEDQIWFWMAVAGFPLLILALGIVVVRLRGRS